MGSDLQAIPVVHKHHPRDGFWHGKAWDECLAGGEGSVTAPPKSAAGK